MLPVGRKPVVQYVVEELERVGVNQLLFITGSGKVSIENHFDLSPELTQTLREDGKEELLQELSFAHSPMQYFYTRQKQLLGLGHAVLCAEPFVGDQPFIVALGDSIIGMHAQSRIVERMTTCYHEKNADAVIAFQEVPKDQVYKYGIAKPKTTGDVFEIEDLIEKPSVDEAPGNLAIAARYVLSPAIFDALKQTGPGAGDEIQLTDSNRILLQQGKKVWGVKLGSDEKRYDIGNFGTYFRAFTEFALADETFGPELKEYLKNLLNENNS